MVMMDLGMMPVGSRQHFGRGDAGSLFGDPAGPRPRRFAAYSSRRWSMQVNITFRHLDSTEALKSHVVEKVQHIQRYIDRPTEAHAVLYVDNLAHHADISMKAGPFFLRGRAKSEDMYASIDAAAEKIERQLKKHKDKLKDHKATAIP